MTKAIVTLVWSGHYQAPTEDVELSGDTKLCNLLRDAVAKAGDMSAADAQAHIDGAAVQASRIRFLR